jgi:hypothetical protein
LGVQISPEAPYAAVVQLVEHRIEDPGVGGSIPSCGTINITRSYSLMEEHCLGMAVMEVQFFLRAPIFFYKETK